MQITVVTLCTLSVSAPIMVVGGTVMAFRQDGALSLILVVGMAILLVFTGILIAWQLPLYEVVQAGIDRVNQVLREQITGMRVVRAGPTASMTRSRTTTVEWGCGPEPLPSITVTS